MSSTENNPLLEQADTQAKSQEIIERYISEHIGKSVFQEGRKDPVGVIIPEGLNQEGHHNLAFVFCNDGSLARISVDNYTNRFINPETLDVVVIPDSLEFSDFSKAAAVSGVISLLGEGLENKGDCETITDIDSEPEKILDLLKDTVERRKQELSQKLANRENNKKKVNDILGKL